LDGGVDARSPGDGSGPVDLGVAVPRDAGRASETGAAADGPPPFGTDVAASAPRAPFDLAGFGLEQGTGPGASRLVWSRRDDAAGGAAGLDSRGNVLAGSTRMKRYAGADGQDLPGFDVSSGLARAIAATSSGELFLAGQAGGMDVWVGRFDAGGVQAWSRTLRNASRSTAAAITLAPDGSAVIVGDLEAGGPFDGDLWLARVASDGTPLWARTFDIGRNDVGLGVVVDRDGQITVLAESEALDGAKVPSVRRHDPMGGFRWARAETGGSAGGVAVDGAGNVIASFSAALVDAGGKTTDAVVWFKKYTSSGALLWTQRFAPDRLCSGAALAADAAGNIIVSGRCRPRPGSGSDAEGLLRKYGPDGVALWTQTLAPEVFPERLLVDSDGSVFLIAAAADVGGAARRLVQKYSP
jgi:hypothetical protein